MHQVIDQTNGDMFISKMQGRFGVFWYSKNLQELFGAILFNHK
jgi:hypothetical protein